MAAAQIHICQLGSVAVFCADNGFQLCAVHAQSGQDDLRLGAVGHERRIARQLVDGEIQVVFCIGGVTAETALGIGCHIEHDPVAGAVRVRCRNVVHQDFAGIDRRVNIDGDRLAQALAVLAPGNGGCRLDDLAGVVLLRKLQLAIHHFQVILIDIPRAHGADHRNGFVYGLAALQQGHGIFDNCTGGHRHYVIILLRFKEQLVLGLAAAGVGVAAAVDEIAAADGALAVEIIGLARRAEQDAAVAAVLDGGHKVAGLIACLTQQTANRAAGGVDGAGVCAVR